MFCEEAAPFHLGIDCAASAKPCSAPQEPCDDAWVGVLESTAQNATWKEGGSLSRLNRLNCGSPSALALQLAAG